MENDLELLLQLGGAIHLKEEKKERTIFNNIFGGNKNNEKVSYLNTDEFFIDIYDYYYKGGFCTIIVSEITEILAHMFGIIFMIFIFILLDWGKILQCGTNNEIKDCGELHNYINPKSPNSFYILSLIISLIFTVCKIILFIYNYKNILYIHKFYKNNLEISSKDLQTMTWPQVINIMSKNQKINLTICEITNRILRKENYYIGLINKDIFKINNKFYTKQLEINIQYALSDLKNLNSEKLKRKFILYGLFNLIFSIFIFIYILIYFLASNIDDLYSNKNIGTRKYSLLSKWKFRDYNELQHFFEQRINKSIKHSYEYLKQFPSPIIEIVCKFICLISGAFIGFLLILSILDESILLYVRLFDRTLIFYTGVFGAISATSRSFLKTPENKVYDPNGIMKKIFKHTHYMPNHWNNKCNTYDTRDEFLDLFPYTIIIFLFDLISVITTPIILIFILPKTSSDIVNFIKFNTTHTKTIGNICSFAKFDEEENNDKKIQRSKSGFFENHGIDKTESINNLFTMLEPIDEKNSMMYSSFI